MPKFRADVTRNKRLKRASREHVLLIGRTRRLEQTDGCLSCGKRGRMPCPRNACIVMGACWYRSSSPWLVRRATKPRFMFAGCVRQIGFQLKSVVLVHVDSHGFHLRSTISISYSPVQSHDHCTIAGAGVLAASAESPPPRPFVLWVHTYAHFPSGFA